MDYQDVVARELLNLIYAVEDLKSLRDVIRLVHSFGYTIVRFRGDRRNDGYLYVGVFNEASKTIEVKRGYTHCSAVCIFAHECGHLLLQKLGIPQNEDIPEMLERVNSFEDMRNTVKKIVRSARDLYPFTF